LFDGLGRLIMGGEEVDEAMRRCLPASLTGGKPVGREFGVWDLGFVEK
jgi:hypothetical protein